MQGINLKINTYLIKDIVNGFKNIVPENIYHTIYQPRYDHHLTALVDGIAKLNYITNKRDKLEVEEEDYKEAKELLEFILASWTDANTNELSQYTKIDFLPTSARKVYNYIKKNPDCNLYDILKNVDADPRRWIKTLLNQDLIMEHTEVSIKTKKEIKYYHASNEL